MAKKNSNKAQIPPQQPLTEAQKEAQRTLDRVERESHPIGTSSFQRTAEHIRGHFAADDMEEKDKAEILGARIGRVLAVVAAIWLAYWLFGFLTRGA